VKKKISDKTERYDSTNDWGGDDRREDIHDARWCGGLLPAIQKVLSKSMARARILISQILTYSLHISAYNNLLL
jgi:hypothetical protein